VANFSGNTGLLAPHLLSANSRLISTGSLRAKEPALPALRSFSEGGSKVEWVELEGTVKTKRPDSTEVIEGFIWGSIKKQTLPQQGFSLLAERKVRGQGGRPKMLARRVFSTLRTFFHRQRRHRALQPVPSLPPMLAHLLLLVYPRC